MLGQRVLRPPPKLALAHGRRRVGLYRLVVPEYFVFSAPRVRVPDALPDDL